MAAVFWDDEGWLLVDFLDGGDSITVGRYCSTLECFGRPFIPEGIGCCARPSSFCTTSLGPTLPTGHVTDFCQKAMVHPPNSPYLTHSDFHLFGPLEKHLTGQRFAIDADVKQSFTSWFQGLDADFFYADLQTFVSSETQFMSVVTTSRSDVCHPLPTYHVYIEVRMKCLSPWYLLRYF